MFELKSDDVGLFAESQSNLIIPHPYIPDEAD